MIAPNLQRWTTALDAALESDEDTDLEPLWLELGSAINARPGDADLRRLRIRMAEAIRDHRTRHADLLALRSLDPADRQAWLDLALLQHRWAFLLVDDDDSDDDEVGEAEAEADDADCTHIQVSVRAAQPEADEPQAGLEAEALRWIAELLATHQPDAAFCTEVFACWSDANIYAPWLRLRLALQAAATHPHDPALQRVLAEAWDDLANQAPESYNPEGPPPMGFLFDVGGTLWDPFLIDRALQGYAQLLASAPGDTDLLRRRARLAEAMCDFPAAANDFAAAGQALEDAAAGIADPDEQAQALSDAQDLRARAALCRGGRAALQQDAAAAIDQAMERLRTPLPHGAGSEAAQAFLAEWDDGRDERLESLSTDLSALRELQSTVLSTPDAEQLAQMEALARKLAGNVVGSVQLVPMQIEPIAADAFEGDWVAALETFRGAMATIGWQDLGWAEWPGFRAMLGHQAVSSLWCDPASGTLALGFAARGTVLVDLETELADGRLLVTSLSRGRNFLTGGPRVDTLFIEPTLSYQEACALHVARVAWTLAQAQGGSACRPASVPDIAAVQESARQAKTHFRLAEGLTLPEALGVPHDFPELFAPMLQAATREALAPLRAPT